MIEKEFKPALLGIEECLDALQASVVRTRSLSYLLLDAEDKKEPLERFRAEGKVYMSYTRKLKKAILEGRK